ncbi:hypothetical protein DFH27DRAFT_201924 [Peziza echinospora]|nr:hypothetical protein DFH27DRAFT_201924 [Peziza echinospora]
MHTTRWFVAATRWPAKTLLMRNSLFFLFSHTGSRMGHSNIFFPMEHSKRNRVVKNLNTSNTSWLPGCTGVGGPAWLKQLFRIHRSRPDKGHECWYTFPRGIGLAITSSLSRQSAFDRIGSPNLSIAIHVRPQPPDKLMLQTTDASMCIRNILFLGFLILPAIERTTRLDCNQEIMAEKEKKRKRISNSPGACGARYSEVP